VSTQVEPQSANAHHKILNDRQTKAVVGEIREFIEMASRGAEARIGSLRGPSRVGKSTIVRKLRSLYPPVMEAGVRIQPIIYVKIPGNPTIKVVLTECLEALGVKSLARDPAPQLVRRLKYFVKECGVRLVVFDEFQHFHNVRGSSRSGLYDTIKSILNDCRCPILAVGVDNSLSVIQADPQLDGRCIYRRELRPFLPPRRRTSAADTERVVPVPTFNEFQNVVHQFFATYGLKVADDLLEGESAILLHDASNGLYGKLIDIVDRSAIAAAAQNASTVTPEIVRSVIEVLNGDPVPDELTPIEAAVADAEMPSKKPKRRGSARIIARIEEAGRNLPEK
jgi:hypothetical protein